MPTFFFHSAMAGAPTNTSAAGSTLEIIRSCLVTGFNLKSVVSASVASGVMTLNYAAPHGYEDKVWLRLDGAAGGSIVQRVTTSAGASSLTIPAPGFADGPVAGALSTRVAPADWEEAFTGTNKAVFRSKVIGPGSTRFFYRIADTAAGGLPRILRGFESMTDVDTGIGPFPTVTQEGADGGRVWRSDSSTPMPWAAVCDGRTVYLTLKSSTAFWSAMMFFGDIEPLGSADLFCATVPTDSSENFRPSNWRHYMPRAASGGGASSSVMSPDSQVALRSYPSSITGGLMFMRPWLSGTGGASNDGEFRGIFRGVMRPTGNPIASTLDAHTVMTGVNGITGRVAVLRAGQTTLSVVGFPIDEDWA